MLHLKNVDIYIPDVTPEGFEGQHVIFFQSEDGVDFYEAIKKAKENTVKILYREKSITGFGTDASGLYPAGSSLIEVAPGKVPADLDLSGKYEFDAKKVTFSLSEAYKTQLLNQAKDKALKVAAGEMEAIQDKIDIGKATEEDLELLTEWKKYRITVREVTDLSDLPAPPVA